MKIFKIELFDGHDTQFKYDRVSNEVTEDHEKVKIVYSYELTGYAYSTQQEINCLAVGDRLFFEERYLLAKGYEKQPKGHVEKTRSQAITRIK